MYIHTVDVDSKHACKHKHQVDYIVRRALSNRKLMLVLSYYLLMRALVFIETCTECYTSKYYSAIPKRVELPSPTVHHYGYPTRLTRTCGTRKATHAVTRNLTSNALLTRDTRCTVDNYQKIGTWGEGALGSPYCYFICPQITVPSILLKVRS